MGRSNFIVLALLSCSILASVFGLAIIPIRPSSLFTLPTPIPNLTPVEQLGYPENGPENLAYNPSRPHQRGSDSDELAVISKVHAAPEQRDDSESVLLKILNDMHMNITSSNSTNQQLFQEPTRPVEVISPSNEDDPEDEIPCTVCDGSPRQLESSAGMDDDLERYFEFLEQQRNDIEQQGHKKREEKVTKEELPPSNEWPPKEFVYDPDPSEPDFSAGCPPSMTCGVPSMKLSAPNLDDEAEAQCTSIFCRFISGA